MSLYFHSLGYSLLPINNVWLMFLYENNQLFNTEKNISVCLWIEKINFVTIVQQNYCWVFHEDPLLRLNIYQWYNKIKAIGSLYVIWQNDYITINVWILMLVQFFTNQSETIVMILCLLVSLRCELQFDFELQKELNLGRRSSRVMQRKSFISNTSPTLPRCHSPMSGKSVI